MLTFLISFKPAYPVVIDEIMAMVGDLVITKYEVEALNPKKINEIYSISDKKLKDKTLQGYYKDALNFLVEQYIVQIAAERDGVSISDKEVENAFAEVLARNNATFEELDKILGNEGLTIQQYKWNLKMDILNAKIRSRVLSPLVVITEEDIKNHIDNKQSELALDDKYELRMIVLDKNTDSKKIMKYIKKDHSFADAAIHYSTDKTAKSGGYLGWINLNHLPEEIRSVIIEKKTGDIFVVNNDEREQIFLIEGFKDKYKIEEELRKEIIDKLTAKRYPVILNNWLQRHKTNIFVKYPHR